MPTYDYECRKGHRFEAFQKMSDEPVSECPECGADAQRKISGGAGFLFKGEGFYITESRSDDYKKKASADSGDASSSKSDKGKSDKNGGKSTSASSGKQSSKTSSDS
jgi:putative FmdB family regulatory protein